jgi:adenine-specific DNA-methyltransferase
MLTRTKNIADTFNPAERAVVYPGDCLELLRDIPTGSIRLVITSPPYNIGKEYEKRINLDRYLRQQEEVITECVRALSPQGNIC